MMLCFYRTDSSSGCAMPSNHLPCYLSSEYEVSPNLSQSLGVCCNQCIGTPWSGNRSPAMRTISSRVTFPQPISLLAPAFLWCGTLTMAGIPPKSNFVPELKGWKLDFARNLLHQLPSLPRACHILPSALTEKRQFILLGHHVSWSHLTPFSWILYGPS